MLALFGFLVCVNYGASPGWWLFGLVCLVLSY
jgi:hypothetical protein